MPLPLLQRGTPSCAPWARMAAWLALVVVLVGSVAVAGHLHGIPGTHLGTGHQITGAAADDDSNCLLCTVHGSASPVQGFHADPLLRQNGPATQLYAGRDVPATVDFALSNRPPPAAL